MNKIDHAEKLLQLTEEGTSPFHVTASVERQLQEAGFKKVQLGKTGNWKREAVTIWFTMEPVWWRLPSGNATEPVTPSAWRRLIQTSRDCGSSPRRR